MYNILLSVLLFALFTLLGRLLTLQVGGSQGLQYIQSFAFSHRHAHISPYFVILGESVACQETWEVGAVVRFLKEVENARGPIWWQ